MDTRQQTYRSEVLYRDDIDDDQPAVRQGGSPSLSLTLREFEELYRALREIGERSSSMPLVAVEGAARDLGLWPLPLDVICQLSAVVRRRTLRNQPGTGDDCGGLTLRDLEPLIEEREEGLTVGDTISLIRLRAGASDAMDVFELLTVERLQDTLSARALRAIDLRQLRTVLEALSNYSRCTRQNTSELECEGEAGTLMQGGNPSLAS